MVADKGFLEPPMAALSLLEAGWELDADLICSYSVQYNAIQYMLYSDIQLRNMYAWLYRSEY